MPREMESFPNGGYSKALISMTAEMVREDLNENVEGLGVDEDGYRPRPDLEELKKNADEAMYLTEKSRLLPQEVEYIHRNRNAIVARIVENRPVITTKASMRAVNRFFKTVNPKYHPLSSREQREREKLSDTLRQKYVRYTAQRELAISLGRAEPPNLIRSHEALLQPDCSDESLAFNKKIKDNITSKDPKRIAEAFGMAVENYLKTDIESIDLTDDKYIVEHFEELQQMISSGAEIKSLMDEYQQYADLGNPAYEETFVRLNAMQELAATLRLKVDTITSPIYSQVRLEDVGMNYDPYSTETIESLFGESSPGAYQYVADLEQARNIIVMDMANPSPLMDKSKTTKERFEEYRKGFNDPKQKALYNIRAIPSKNPKTEKVEQSGSKPMVKKGPEDTAQPKIVSENKIEGDYKMPIDSKRAKQFLNMVAEDRQVKKLLGEGNDLEKMFNQLNNYLYPPSAKAKNIIPDEATQRLMLLLNDLRPLVHTLDSVKDPVIETFTIKQYDAKKRETVTSTKELVKRDGLNESEELEFKQKLTSAFSGDPKPEDTVADYLKSHGDKHLASPEIQFATALINAFRGVQDVLEHEKTLEQLQEQEYTYKNIKANLTTDIPELQKNLEKKGVKNGVAPDEKSISRLEKDIEEQTRQIKSTEVELLQELKSESKKFKLTIPGNSRYMTARTEYARMDKEYKQAAKNAVTKRNLEATAESYEKEQLPQMMEELAVKDKLYQESRAQYDEMRKDFNEKSEQRRAQRKENQETIETMLRNPNMEAKRERLLEIPYQRMDLERATQQLQELFSDPQKAYDVGRAVFAQGKVNLHEEIEDMEAQNIWKSGTDAQKYMLAKDMILATYADNTEEKAQVENEFHRLESMVFQEPILQQVSEALLNEIIPNKQAQLQQEQQTLDNDEEIKKYRALESENEQLDQLDVERRKELSNKDKEKSHYLSEVNHIKYQHREMCEKLIQKASIVNNKNGVDYTDMKNWQKLREGIHKSAETVYATRDELAAKAKNGKLAMEAEGKALEKLRDDTQYRSKKEIEIGKKLEQISAQKAELNDKKQRLEDAKELKSEFEGHVKGVFKREDNFCRRMDESLGGKFANDKIAERLEKLRESLAAPKRGKDSPEYTQLKEALEQAQKVFSGKENDWNKMTPTQQKQREKEALSQLSEKAEHYLTEKDKQPHLWPFASASGFQRRAAANDILTYCKSANQIVENTPDVELELANRIADHKMPDGAWKESLMDTLLGAKMDEFDGNVKTGIEEDLAAQNQKTEDKVLENENDTLVKENNEQALNQL